MAINDESYFQDKNDQIKAGLDALSKTGKNIYANVDSAKSKINDTLGNVGEYVRNRWDELKERGDRFERLGQHEKEARDQAQASSIGNSRMWTNIRNNAEDARRERESQRELEAASQRNWSGVLPQNDYWNIAEVERIEREKRLKEDEKEARDQAQASSIGNSRMWTNIQNDAEDARRLRELQKNPYVQDLLKNIPAGMSKNDFLNSLMKKGTDELRQDAINNGFYSFKEFCNSLGGMEGSNAYKIVQNWWNNSPNASMQLTGGAIGAILVAAGAYALAKKWKEYRKRKKEETLANNN